MADQANIDQPAAHRPARSSRTWANLAAAGVLVALAVAYPTQRFWVFLVIVIASAGELIRWRRARRAGDDGWRPLRPASSG